MFEVFALKNLILFQFFWSADKKNAPLQAVGRLNKPFFLATKQAIKLISAER